MIHLEKISPKINLQRVPVSKKKSNSIEELPITDLDSVPHYPIISPIYVSKKYLSKFLSEYGKPKSYTYNFDKIRTAKANNLDSGTIDKLDKEGRVFKSKIKKMRNDLWSQKFPAYGDYLHALSCYVKEHGPYINCNETADLVKYLLAKDGIKSQNIFMYSVNNNGERINNVEHVFCVIGLNKNANIEDISTWDDSCSICDPWANIAMNAQDGIKFYEKFFNIDKNKHSFCFESADNSFPS